MERKVIEELIADYCAGTLSKREAKELRRYLREHPEAERSLRDAREAQSVLRAIRIREGVDAGEAERRVAALLARRNGKRRIVQWLWGGVAAAAVLVVALMVVRPGGLRQSPPLADMTERPAIVPGEVKATLRDESGQALEITSGSTSRIVTPDGTVVENDSLEGLRYDRSVAGEEVKMQTLTVPVGGEYRFTLADGTRVWVNSASEVRFPTRFTGERREIHTTGEVYLEVAHDSLRPFIVRSGDKSVQVLGTKFNFMAYPDERQVVTTLVEGSVAFCDAEHCVRLRPGEQVVLDETAEKIDKRRVDVSLYTSWVTGSFEYERMALEDIARQLSRWYNVRFVFDAPEFRTHLFTGVVRRTQTLDEVLVLMEKTTDVSFEIVDRVVHVKRAKDGANISRS